MMTPRMQKALKSVALLLIFCVAQLYIQVNLAAGPSAASGSIPMPAQGAVGKLVIHGNQPVLVNGNAAHTGDTISTGAMLETGDQTGATIDLGSLGSVELAPNTKAVLDYSDGQVKVKIITGCVIIHSKKGTSGDISTDQGSAAHSDSSAAGLLNVCLPPGATSPVVNSATNVAGAAGGGGAAGASHAALIATVLFGVAGAVIVGFIVANHESSNPSGATP